MATLAFSGKVHEVIQLLKAFEIGFEIKSDAKTISFIGTFSVPEVLFYRFESSLKILLLSLLYQELLHQ